MYPIVSGTGLEPVVSSFELAEVHMATFLRSNDASAHLVLGVIELLPVDLPPPPPETAIEAPVQAGTLRLERLVLPAASALNWYKAAKETRLYFPGDPSRRLEVPSPLGEEPTLSTPGLFTGGIPFAGSHWFGARVCQLVPLKLPFGGVLTEDDGTWSSVQKFVSENFHFDFANYLEFAQSITLVAPNPVVRTVRQRLLERGDTDVLVVQIEQRACQGPTQYQVIVREQRGTTQDAALFLLSSDEPHEIPLRKHVEAVGLSVFHPDRGLVYHEKPERFLRSIGVNVSFSPPSRTVQTSHGPIEVVQREPSLQAPVQGFVSAAAALRAEEQRRGAEDRQSDKQAIAMERNTARLFVQRLIATASSDVMLVDPYFTHADLHDFAYMTSNSNVRVKILASALGFQEPSGPSTSRSRRKQAAELLAELKASVTGASVEVRVMSGRKVPDSHDRFVVVDGTVWTLGGSLADLGNRMSLMQEARDPGPVRKVLDTFWQVAQRLVDWVALEIQEE